MKHKGLLIAFILTVLFGGAFLVGLVLALLAGGGDPGDGWALSGRVGVVTVDGAIVSADDAVAELDRFRDEDNIKSVILRIESPGGSVAASQEIFEAVKRLAQKKPVVASMGSVAASGGYYIACGATKILANPGTVTGSIGVRMEHVMLGDLLRWAKIGHETLKSGRFKDLGSFDRPLSPEDRALLQGLIDDIHVQFKETVAQSRKLDAAKVDELADGRVYTGRQAQALGLVDELGGLSEAVKLAGTLGGLGEDPKLVHPKKRLRVIERMMEGASALLEQGVRGAFDVWQPMLMMPIR